MSAKIKVQETQYEDRIQIGFRRQISFSDRTFRVHTKFTKKDTEAVGELAMNIISDLLLIQGVVRITIQQPYEFFVEKGSAFEWKNLKPHIEGIIQCHLNAVDSEFENRPALPKPDGIEDLEKSLRKNIQNLSQRDPRD